METFGVGVNVCVAVGEGVAVKGFAASVCFASAMAVLAREVSTAGGLTTGAGVRLQPLTVKRRMDPIRMKNKSLCFMDASVIKNPFGIELDAFQEFSLVEMTRCFSVSKFSLKIIIRREGCIFYIPN
jgi:hypothetical protein